MVTDRYTKIVLTAIALSLTAIACRPYLDPPDTLAGANPSDLYIEPGVYSLRAPDGSRVQLGKVVIDLRSGKVWGFPSGSSSPYPYSADGGIPVSKPFLLAKWDLESVAP